MRAGGGRVIAEGRSHQRGGQTTPERSEGRTTVVNLSHTKAEGRKGHERRRASPGAVIVGIPGCGCRDHGAWGLNHGAQMLGAAGAWRRCGRHEVALISVRHGHGGGIHRLGARPRRRDTTVAGQGHEDGIRSFEVGQAMGGAWR